MNNNNKDMCLGDRHVTPDTHTDGLTLPASVTPDTHRVVLHGVDMSLTPAHVRSIVEQLRGVAPVRVHRPALDMLPAYGHLSAAAHESSDNGVKSNSCEPSSRSLADNDGNTKKVDEDEACGSGVVGGCEEAASAPSVPACLLDVDGMGGVVIIEVESEGMAEALVGELHGCVINARRIRATR